MTCESPSVLPIALGRRTDFNGTLTVIPAELYVVANSYRRPINTPNPPFGYTIYGFVNGDTQGSATTGVPALGLP
jgi:hypothetical protein